MGPPPEWGNDEITTYLDKARNNQFATFVHKPIVQDLREIDGCYRRLITGWTNPQPFFPTPFVCRAHSNLLCATGLAMAGQVYETFPILRSCLECGAYGLHIGTSEERAEIWLRRQESEKSLREMRNEFVAANLRTTMAGHEERLKEIYEELYQRTIDFGGHPNELGLLGGIAEKEEPGEKRFETQYLCADDVSMDHALRATAEVGLWVLHCFRYVYPARFSILGIDVAIQQIRQRF